MDNGGFNEELHHCHLPVAVDVGSTEGKAVVDEGGVNEDLHRCHLPVAMDVENTEKGGAEEDLHRCHLPIAVDVGSTEGKAVVHEGGVNEDLHCCHLPVAVDMGSTEGKAVVDEGGVDEDPLLSPFQQVIQVTQVSVAAPHPIARTVLIQHKDLARAEPTLGKHKGALSVTARSNDSPEIPERGVTSDTPPASFQG